MKSFIILITLMRLAAAPVIAVEGDLGTEDLLRLVQSDIPSEREGASALLVSGGHIPTIRRLIDEKLADFTKGEVLMWPGIARVSSMPLLFEALPKASLDFPPVGPDVSLAPTRLRFATLIFRIIMADERFPAATRKWADQSLSGVLSAFGVREKGDLERVSELTEWWDHNKATIIEGKPEDATWLPGDPTVGDKAVRSPARQPDAQPAEGAKPIARDPAGEAAPIRTQTTTERSSVIAWTAGILLAAAALLAVLKLKRSRG